ncbi:MAG: hypothetical protein KDD47_17040, partial [Acidobacteria bacterium]|nr:hypothetical protein [Acidobacteriota bacterium]
GQAQTRDLGSGGGPAEASAGTVVRVVARPEGTLGTAVVFGLYRQAAGELHRIPESALDLQLHGGAATLAARAGDLIQGEPGLYTLYLVVARPGDLPSSLSTKSGESPQDRLSDGGRRRAYPFSIRWLPELPAEPSTPGDNVP